jgi:hypothetical protein
MSDLSDYLADNYGRCRLAGSGIACVCIKGGWRSQGCKHWISSNASNWSDLRELQRLFVEELRRGR